MKIKINPVIQNFGKAGFIAYLSGIPGMVVQGDSEEEVREELIKSLEVKIAYDYGFEIE